MDGGKDELGRWGERHALRFLRRQGYRIIKRNYVSPLGEIDIIAREGDVVAFVEVKTRTSDDFGGPLEAVGRDKRRKIALVARYYLARSPDPEIPCRFDVVGVTRVEGTGEPEIELVRGAFTLDRR